MHRRAKLSSDRLCASAYIDCRAHSMIYPVRSADYLTQRGPVMDRATGWTGVTEPSFGDYAINVLSSGARSPPSRGLRVWMGIGRRLRATFLGGGRHHREKIWCPLSCTTSRVPGADPEGRRCRLRLVLGARPEKVHSCITGNSPHGSHHADRGGTTTD